MKQRCALHRALDAPMAMLLAASAAACTTDSDVKGQIARLGEVADTIEVAREVRAVLPAAAAVRLTLPGEKGCVAHLAHVAVEGAGAPGVRVRIGDPTGGATTVYEDASEAADGWRDVRVELPAGSRELELNVTGTDPEAARWARPLLDCPAPGRAHRRYNLALVSLDTLRADRLGAYGNRDALTPTLDRVAREGTLFEYAYSPFPNTLGSHATLFTGHYPSSHGLKTAAGQMLAADVETLAAAFASAGYATAAFTENAFVSSDFGFANGFDLYHNGPLGEGDGRFPGEAATTFARAVRWLERRPAAPFFVFLHTYQVHAPYTPTTRTLAEVMDRRGESYAGRFATHFGGLAELAFNRGRIELSPADIAQVERLYDAETIELDREVAVLLRELRRLELDRDTLVVFFSDHGDEMAEHGKLGHGESLHEEVLHVPLLLRLPGVVPAGKRLSPRVGLIDVGPTVAELAGIDPPFTRAPARSRAGWVIGEAPERSDTPVFAELNASITACEADEGGGFETCELDAVAVRDQRYTYIHLGVPDREMLYRFPEDLYEQTDVAADEPEVAAKYRGMADDFREHATGSALQREEADLDPATAEKLRALGYIE